jgi:hypothetical protein
MGYTHYWRREASAKDSHFGKTQYGQVVSHVQKMIEDTAIPVDRVKIDSEHIHFNGVGDDGHEDFWLDLAPGEQYGNPNFSFCKTALRPYDVLVTAALCIAKHYLGDQIRVSTDGLPDEWKDGLLLARKYVPGCGFPYDRQAVWDAWTQGYREDAVNQYDAICKELGLPIQNMNAGIPGTSG